MELEHPRRGGASKSRQLQALGNILLWQADEESAAAPEPDLSFSPENCLVHDDDDAMPDEAFDPAWANDS